MILRIITYTISVWFLVGVLTGCASVGPFLAGFEGASEEFIHRHAYDSKIVGDKLYPNPVKE